MAHLAMSTVSPYTAGSSSYDPEQPLYAWIPTGSSYIVAPTMGDFTSAAIHAWEAEGYVDWNSTQGFWFSQAATVVNSREAGISRSNTNLTIYVGEVATNFTTGSIFPEGIDGVLRVRVDLSQAEVSFWLNGYDMGTYPVGVGSSRVNGTKLRIGARANEHPDVGTTGTWLFNSSDRVSDIRITRYLNNDTVDTRYYKMPASGTTITETEQGQNGTLYNGDGTDFEEITLPPQYIPPSAILAGVGSFYNKVKKATKLVVKQQFKFKTKR